jgi:hypothetical protein
MRKLTKKQKKQKMKKQLFAILSTTVILASCQKEMSDKQTTPATTTTISNEVLPTDTVYFHGLQIGQSPSWVYNGHTNKVWQDWFTLPDSTGIYFKQIRFLIQKKGNVTTGNIKLFIDDVSVKRDNFEMQTSLDTIITKLIKARELTPIYYQVNPYSHTFTLAVEAWGNIGDKYRVGFVNAVFLKKGSDGLLDESASSKNVIPVSTPRGWVGWSVFLR